ncbi:DUF6438 domain-containing protein [Pseudofulvibacter geojedonensis]|uniref:DUF6438 domain-containing protein n=1 Tax=Pseudofulvibacter geojedonensis TaxID=1123758 RepID=A0ABW3I438_9FLAO
MKIYIIIAFSLLIFSCKSNQQLSPKNSLISISKNPCLKNCEVSDLHFYSDGTFIYNGVLNTHLNGNYKGKISLKELSEIKNTLNELSKDIPLIKGRDIPSITIKYESANKTYHANHKELKNLKLITEKIVSSIK